jgi:outer membrane protein assembly factor BamB
MKLLSLLLPVISAIGPAVAAGPTIAGELLYTLDSATTLPSTDTGYDYIKMQPGSNRLFMARLADGLTVFDVDKSQAVATVENSVGANGPLLLPEYNRGYVAMNDGSLLSFDLKTLAPIARSPLAKDGGLNSVIHDPYTGQIHAIVGRRPEQSTWFTLDAATGKLLKTTTFPFQKMDDPASDGEGRLFAPAREDAIVLVLDARTLEEKARWPVGCNVSKIRYQAATDRVLGACVGVKPSFFALDADTGRMIATFPIGANLDGFVIDEQRQRIVTSSQEGVLNVIGQDGANGFKLLGTVATRMGARMMTLDERNGRLCVVNATFTSTAPNDKGETTKTYHPDSFVVLTFSPH